MLYTAGVLRAGARAPGLHPPMEKSSMQWVEGWHLMLVSIYAPKGRVAYIATAVARDH